MSDFEEFVELITTVEDSEIRSAVENQVSIAQDSFGGSALYIPKISPEQRKERDEEIKKLFDSGVPVREIAHQKAMSDKQVRRILSGAKPKPNKRNATFHRDGR